MSIDQQQRIVEILQATVAGMQQVVTQSETNIKAIFKRLDRQEELVKSVYGLASSVEIMAAELQHMRKEHDDMRADVDQIKSKPSRRWEDLTKTTITVVVTSVITFLLAQLLN